MTGGEKCSWNMVSLTIGTAGGLVRPDKPEDTQKPTTET